MNALNFVNDSNAQATKRAQLIEALAGLPSGRLAALDVLNALVATWDFLTFFCVARFVLGSAAASDKLFTRGNAFVAVAEETETLRDVALFTMTEDAWDAAINDAKRLQREHKRTLRAVKVALRDANHK